MIIVQDVYDPVEPGSRLDQNSAGVPGVAEAGDRFGRSLDTVNVICDGTSRLAVGVPGEDVGSAANAGSVQLFSSDESNLAPGVGLTQDTAGVSGVAEPGDLFGDRLAFAAAGLGEQLDPAGRQRSGGGRRRRPTPAWSRCSRSPISTPR